jgi:hypothetical protein
MNKILIITVLLNIFLAIGCSKDYLFNKQQDTIAQEINTIFDNDQKIRHELTFVYKKYNIRTFETIIDSIDRLKLTTTDGINFSSIQPVKIQIQKLSETDRINFLKDKKEYEKKMSTTDSMHRIRAIRIIKKYGFPGVARNWKTNKKFGITTVATHFKYQDKTGKKLIKLIIKEYNKGRVDTSEMKHMLWNLNHRTGEIDSINVRKMIRKIEIDYDL